MKLINYNWFFIYIGRTMYTLMRLKQDFYVLRRIELHNIYQINIGQKKATMFSINVKNE